MKSPYIGTLVANDVVTAHFLVLSKEIRQKKTGEPYLSLHLGDRTGEMEAKMWDNVSDVMNTFERDDFVKVKGIVQIFQNRSQFTVHRLRRLEDHEVDFADFFPCSDRNLDEMFAELQTIIAELGNPHLRTLLRSIFDEPSFAERYRIAPAAKNIHHACRGGLLEHVLSLCSLCRLIAPHYKDVDLDLLLSGAILHDIGKVQELSYSRSFGYSPEGQLLGHIVIGLRIIGNKFDQLPEFPQKLRTLLEHMIISHHGELEFGSPKVPAFREALLLHHLDNLDSKMEAFRNALKRDHHVEGEFTGWIPSLERVLLKKERYLNESLTPQSSKADTTTAQVPKSQSDNETASENKNPPATTRPESETPVSLTVPPSTPASRPAPTTLFGEKLQAVLQSRK